MDAVLFDHLGVVAKQKAALKRPHSRRFALAIATEFFRVSRGWRCAAAGPARSGNTAAVH